MSFVEVLPIEPVIATNRAPLRSRTRPASAASAAKASSGTSVAAAPRAKACLTKSTPAADRDEQVAVLDPARVGLQAGHLGRPRRDLELPRGELRDLVERERDHAVARSARSASPATSRSSNGTTRPAISWPALVPLAGDHDDVARLGELDRAARSPRGGRARLPARRSSRPAPRRRSPRILAARVVGGDDRDVGELGRDPAHLRPLAAVAVAAAAEDADHAAGSSSSRAARRTFSSAPGLWA